MNKFDKKMEVAMDWLNSLVENDENVREFFIETYGEVMIEENPYGAILDYIAYHYDVIDRLGEFRSN